MGNRSQGPWSPRRRRVGAAAPFATHDSVSLSGREAVGRNGGLGLTLRLQREPLWVAVGIRLGEFVTNADGEIKVIAPDSALVFGLPRGPGDFKEVAGGPTGTIVGGDDLIVGSGQNITVKRLWTLPEHDYVLKLRTAENQPIAPCSS